MELLGIDVGTGGTRAVVVDERGSVIGSATAEHAPFASPQTGWAEQDPRDWWRATAEAVREVLAQPGVSADSIACIGFSGQMHGAVLLDKDREVLRPALIWCDQRTHPQCRAITEKVGPARLIELTSNPALTAFTLPKMLWVRDQEPDLWRRARSVLLPKDYVRLRLTGERATDVADASGTLLFDVASRRWSNEMLSAIGIDETILPAVFESPEITGRVSAEGAAETGLFKGTPVVAGAGDQAAGAVGMGIVRPGAVSVTIGTSGVVFAATDRPALDQRGRIHTFCHAVPGRWHAMGVTQAAGLSLRWFRDRFGVAEHGNLKGNQDPYDLLCEEAGTAPLGSDGVLWAPHLMGERTPHLDPDARAALVGLTTIRLGGGGARSTLWRQIQADVYRRSVEIVEAEEGAAYGAALLAGVGGGVWASVDEACATAVRIRATIKSEPESVRVMDECYQNYQLIYPALRRLSY